jgi:hypothetical protein
MNIDGPRMKREDEKRGCGACIVDAGDGTE